MKLIKRYPRGKFKIFDDEYDNRLQGSKILNSGNMGPNVSMMLWDKPNVQYELIRLIGVERGMYRDHFNDSVQAIIPFLEQRLTEIEIHFENINIEREMHGQLPLEELPANLLKEKLEIEASLDIHLSEKQLLEEKLKEYENQVEAVRETQVLHYGLRQSISLHGGKISEIDGQSVTYVDNIPVINDKKSPYYGMSVQDYRQLSNKWLAERHQADAEKLKQLQKACKENNQPIPKSLKGKGVKAVNPASLPPYPKEFKNYLITEKTTAK